MARKDDRRVIRTRKLLRESMYTLILERGYDEISIQDVTDHANLARATFYLHYREKDDLLEDLVHQVFEKFLESSAQFMPDKSNLHSPKAIQSLFEIAESQYDFYRIMTMGKGATKTAFYLHKLLREGYARGFSQLESAKHCRLTLPHDFLQSYSSGALLSLIFWWLEVGMPYPPAKMAEMYQKLNLLNGLNPENPKKDQPWSLLEPLPGENAPLPSNKKTPEKEKPAKENAKAKANSKEIDKSASTADEDLPDPAETNPNPHENEGA